MQKTAAAFIFFLLFSFAACCQATHAVTDDEADFKTLKEYIAKEQYGFAYTLVKELKARYPENTASDHAYINEDINYYNALCELQLLQDVGREDAVLYISSVSNIPRRQLMSFYLAHYYFLHENYAEAVSAFDDASFANLSNVQIAAAKFEKAYSLFNLKRFAEAKPLFNEIHQVLTDKYYIPANYYYGFISYFDQQYDEALRSFQLVETVPAYKGVVPYYIAEIYYFRGQKDDALRYGESVLTRSSPLYYADQLRLLLGQIYFEKKNYERALPLLEAYVDAAPKVSKEITYELSYCYYIAGNTQKAIAGFRQLSGERDSLGQNSMYLLGGLYLKTGEKENARNAFQYSAFNSSNAAQQEVSRFNYAKLSYELGYQDAALKELKNFLQLYPNAAYATEAKEMLVALLAGTNNFSDALAVYASLGEPTPAMRKIYPAILYGKAIEYLNDNEPAKADELFAKVMADGNAGKRAGYASFWRGEIAYRRQDYDGAVRLLSAFLQSNLPAQGEATKSNANYDLAYSKFQQEDYKAAAGLFEQVTKTISPASSLREQDAYLRTADAYFMQRDYAAAGEMYGKAIAASSIQADYAVYQQAMIAGIRNGDEKIRLLSTIIPKYPATALRSDINMETALTYIADGKFQQAIPFLRDIIESADGGLKPKAYLELGLAYYNSNNNAEALKAYTALIRDFPQSPEADDAVGIVRNIYVEEGRPDDYVTFMNQNGRAVSVNEADSLSWSVGRAKYEAGDCAAAITALSNYVSKYPNGAFVTDANYLRGECDEKGKDYQNALAAYAYVADKGNGKYFENAALAAGRISYFELKDFAAAKKYFESVRANASKQESRLEALRGLVRSDYALKDYATANAAAQELLTQKAISADDRAVALLVLGKSQQVSGDCAAAVVSFRSAAAISRSEWGAEARYETAECLFTQGNFAAAEKAALATIKETGSYDEWVTRSYILLGDIFIERKDYFNAKATYESVAKNAALPELKALAQQKLDKAVAAEASQSKISN